jgi:putative aldouronate transport system substrate-binding protein
MIRHLIRSRIKSVCRSITLLIVFSLLIVSTGCFAGSENEDESSFMEQYEDDISDDAPPPAPANRSTITILFPGYQPRNWSEVKKEIEKETRNILNVELDFQWKEHYTYINEIKTLQASNQDFDAFILAGPDGSSPDFTKLAKNGVLKDITDIFPQSAPSLYNKYGNEELQYATIGNRLYAVPSLYTMAECPSVITSDSMISKYKIDDITNFDEYEAFLKKIKENEPDAIPAIDTSTFIAALPSAFGYATVDERSMLVYKWDDPQMRLMAWERTPEFYDTVKVFIDWRQKGYIKPVAGQEDYFKAATVLAGVFLDLPSKQAAKMSLSSTIGTTMETGPVRTFRFYPDRTIQRKNPLGKFGTNGSFAFPKESKDTEMVLRFLEWVQCDRKNYNLVVNGIEGTDHVLNDGVAELPKGMNPLSSSYMYWGGCWAFRNIEYEIAEKEAQTHIEYVNSHSEYPPHGVFYPDYGVLEQVMQKRFKGLQDFYSRLSRGEVKSTELLDKFISEMESYGTDELITLEQSQLTQN